MCCLFFDCLWHVFVVILHLITARIIDCDERQYFILNNKVLYLQQLIKRV